MSAQLYALGRWCYRHARTVVAAWLVALLVLGGTAVVFRGAFEDVFEIPGTSSQEAITKLAMTFPQGAMIQAVAIFVAPEGQSIADHRAAIEDTVAELALVDFVDSVTSPWSEYVSGLISDDGRAAMAPVLLDLPNFPTEADLARLTAVAERMAAEFPEGFTVQMGGQAYNIELPHLSAIELIGLGIALAVLTLVLGSLVAAGLPLLNAIVGVGLTMAILMMVARLASINSVTPMLAVMLGLAVGIDYALFVLSRHRDQLRAGMDPQESTARAVGTAGSAVVFAGLTVFIALLGLGVSGIPFLTVMGVFAALAIVFAVAIACTMLPAFMGLLGERLRPKVRAARPRAIGSGAFAWWARVVTSRPIVVIAAVVVGLGALTIPGLSLSTSLPNSGQHVATAPDRITYDLMTEHYGIGRNGLLVLTADVIGSTDPLGVVDDLKQEVLALDGVAAVPLATPNLNAEVAMLQIVPTTGPDDPATAELVHTLRDKHDEWLGRYGVETAVTGMTAIQIDVNQRLAGALLPFGALVVGLSLVLLAAVFRSVWVPIKATAGFLLSVGAAFGATALVFNHGWFKEVVNLERGMPVISFLPILLMGILFGLAMDYEVFLVSRIREEYVHGKKPIDAIRDGFVASGPVVVAAAAIMFSVFAFFVPGGINAIKQIAFALAVGVAIDAFLIRMTLGPAVLALLGQRAWWLPRWLDRALPVFDVEGEVLTEKLRLADWPGTGHLLYAEELEVEGLVPPTSLALAPGNVVGVVGPVAQRTGLVLALTGRLKTTGGRARVAGELLPGAAREVHRRTTYVDLALERQVAQVLRALHPRPGGVVVVDSVEALDSAAAHRALAELIAAFRLDDRAALILAASAASVLESLSLDGVVTVGPTVRSTV